MTEFSERDLDRPWSTGELAQLSERDLARLALGRAVKNAAYFIPVGVVVSQIAGAFGFVGTAIGWVAIVGVSLFALEALAGLTMGIAALAVGFATGKQNRQ
jgi:hypothetical protein